jgi:GAF domain-containing protein
MDAVKEREVLLDIVEALSQDDYGLRSTFRERMLQDLGSIDLTNENLTTLAFGAKNDVSIQGRLEEARDRCAKGLVEIKRLKADSDLAVNDILNQISNDHTDYDHVNGVKFRLPPGSKQQRDNKSKQAARAAGGGAGAGAATSSGGGTEESKGEGQFKYVKTLWEIMTGNINDPEEIPQEVEEMLHAFEKRRRVLDRNEYDVESVDTSGPSLGITFKPKFWQKYDAVDGAEHLKNIRKDALRERHQSTMVVKTDKAKARAMSITSFAAIKSQVASGKLLSFTDLLRSMKIFFHLAEDEMRAFEAACEVIEYQEDESILNEGDLMGTVYLVANGVITTSKEKGGGDTADSTSLGVTGTLTRGDFFGDCVPRDAVAVKARKMKSLLLYQVTSRSVTAYVCPGAVFHKFAYRMNRNQSSEEIIEGLIGSNRALDEMMQTYAARRAKSRLARAVALVQETVGRADNALSMARMNTSHHARKDESSLLGHIDQFLEFSMVVESERYMQDISSAIAVTNKVKAANSMQSAANEAEATASGSQEGAIVKEGNNSSSSQPKAKPRGSIFGGAGPRNSIGGRGAPKRTTIFGVSNDSLAAKNRTSLAARKSLFGRDFTNPNARDRNDLDVTMFDDSSSVTESQTGSEVGSEDPSASELRKEMHELHRRERLQAEIERRLKEAKEHKKRLMQNVLCCTTPENSLQEMLDALLQLIKEFFDVERVGIFVIDKVHGVMSLYRSMDEESIEEAGDTTTSIDNDLDSDDSDEEDAKDIEIGRKARQVEVPLKGLAGHIAKTGKMLNLSDAHEHPLFDKTMDLKTGYRTRQMLCVPCFDSQLSSNVTGVLQIINCRSNADVGDDGVTEQQQGLAAVPEGNEAGAAAGSSALATGSEGGGGGAAAAPAHSGGDPGFVAFSKEDEMLASILATQLGTLFAASLNSRNVVTTNTVGGDPFSVTIDQLIIVPSHDDDGVTSNDRKTFPPTLKVCGEIFHGFSCLGSSPTTVKVPLEPLAYKDKNADSDDKKKNSDDNDASCVYHVAQELTFADNLVRDLPMGARLFLQFYGSKKTPFGWCVIDLFDFQREMVMGSTDLVLWEGAYDQYALSFPASHSVNNHARLAATAVLKVVSLQFKLYDETVVHESAEVRRVFRSRKRSLADYVSRMSAEDRKLYKNMADLGNGRSTKVVRLLPHKEEQIIWKIRHGAVTSFQYLPATMLATSWGRSESATSAYRLLGEWKLPSSTMPDDLVARTLGLGLLQGTFADPKIRSFALFQLLKSVRHSDMEGLWLPLLQCMQYERFYDSSLIRFVLRESLGRPFDLGSDFYWHLVSDNTDHTKLSNRLRAHTLCMAFKRSSGDRVRTHLGHTEYIHEKLAEITRKVLLTEDHILMRKTLGPSTPTNVAFGRETAEGDVVEKDKKMKFLKEGLGDITLPDSFASPCNPALRCRSMNIAATRIVKTFPHKSIKISFVVDTDDPELSSNHERRMLAEKEDALPQSMKKKSQINQSNLWMKVGVDPALEKTALQLVHTMNYIWRVRTEGRAGDKWPATWQGNCIPTYTIISQFFGFGTDKYRSSMCGLPEHAISFQELLQQHHELHELDLQDKTSFADKMTMSKKPKKYTSLQDREFPDDIVENWLSLQNFDVTSTNTKTYIIEQNISDSLGKIPPVVIRSNASKLSNYEKYNQRNPRRRPTIRGLRSTPLKGGMYGPKPEAVAWRRNFARSLAYYYVSSVVLGIENRNTDNIFFLPNGCIFNFELNIFGLDSVYGINANMTSTQIKAKLRALVSSEASTNVPMLSCFLRCLGPRKGRLFKFFSDRAWDAFVLLRRSAALLVTTLKIALMSVPCQLDGANKNMEQEMRGIGGTLAPATIEALVNKLRKNLYLDDDCSKWDDGETEAKQRFSQVLQTALNDGTSTHGADTYPAAARFTVEEFTSSSY